MVDSRYRARKFSFVSTLVAMDSVYKYVSFSYRSTEVRVGVKAFLTTGR
jgi:hypothetical protein